jgi:hypothetical protein
VNLKKPQWPLQNYQQSFNLIVEIEKCTFHQSATKGREETQEILIPSIALLAKKDNVTTEDLREVL